MSADGGVRELDDVLVQRIIVARPISLLYTCSVDCFEAFAGSDDDHNRR